MGNKPRVSTDRLTGRHLMMQIQSSRTQIEIMSEGQASGGMHHTKPAHYNYMAMREDQRTRNKGQNILSWEFALVNINLEH